MLPSNIHHHPCDYYLQRKMQGIEQPALGINWFFKRFVFFHTGLQESLQPCSQAARKWRENEEMRRKWRENEEMERDWLSTFPHSLSISSLFLHFLPLFPFPTSKCITFCCKMLNTALLSRMSQKSQHTRYEEIILGRTCCEEAPQFVPACTEVCFNQIFHRWRRCCAPRGAAKKPWVKTRRDYFTGSCRYLYLWNISRYL